jgi:pimeloyl-ACP methyl ester carboxylesterase
MVGASLAAWLTQTDLGRLEVSNVHFKNFNGIALRAKLFRPVSVTSAHPAPGVIYIHGYQNNRETGDAYSLELARRGFVVLNIDAIGRGNSGEPGDPQASDFDPTFGGTTSIQYLRSLPFVKPDSVGILGHSLGAEMAYVVSLKDPTINALVITGFAYTLKASQTHPKNMLMIIGKWDEFRQRMTGTRDIEKEWMGSERTKRVFPVENPQFGVTYGDFSQGTARRVFLPRITHVQESHHHASIAETVEWMKEALLPEERFWIDQDKQIWVIKEVSTLIAMLACFASVLPFGLMLLRMNFFRTIRGTTSKVDGCSFKSYFKIVTINGILLWLYLPLILVLFAVHKYVVPIDGLFPMMMVNGIVWWFLWVNILGLLIFRRWHKRRQDYVGPNSPPSDGWHQEDQFVPRMSRVLKTVVLGVILFGFMYGSEYVLEQLLIVDFRFIWPFASDLTRYRAWMALLYFPFLLFCFILTGIFLHQLLKLPEKETWQKTLLHWSFWNLFALLGPLILFLLVQYIPLFAAGWIPFEGPGGLFVVFIINLFHTLALLAITSVLSTFFFLLTGMVYLGALVNAAMVTWIFASSQVIAPIPV